MSIHLFTLVYLQLPECGDLFVTAGKFVTVKGTVVRVSCIKPLCVKMAYECMTCRHVQVFEHLHFIHRQFSIKELLWFVPAFASSF